MKTLASILCLTFAPLAFAAKAKPALKGTPAEDVKYQPLALEPLIEQVDYEIACGCQLMDSKDKLLLYSDVQAKSLAIVRFDGKRHELNWVSSTQKKGELKVGDRFTKVYASGPIRLRLNYKTTFVCPKNSETCETETYKVDLKLEDGKREYEMKGVRGDCGC